MRKNDYKPEIVSVATLERLRCQAIRDANTTTRLELARALLESVELPLNASTKVCDCCGATVREDFDEWQAVEALRAAQSRIMKANQSIAAGRLKKHYGVKTFTELKEVYGLDAPDLK